MKQHIYCERNSFKIRSKNLDRKLTLKAIATDLLSKGLRISVTTLSLGPKLGTKILRWCSYRMTLKKRINYPCGFCCFCALPQNVVCQHKSPFLRYGHIYSTELRTYTSYILYCLKN